MYNEELKKNFIQQKTRSIREYKCMISFFNRIEKHEVEFGGDICTMPEKELSEAVVEISGVVESSRKRAFSVIKDYISWCKDNNVRNVSEAIFSIKIDYLETFREKMVSSPADLHDFMNSILRDVEEETVDDIVRGFLWLAFIGLPQEESFKVKTSDVNLEKQVVRYGGAFLPIYDEAMPVMTNLVKLNSFRYYNSNYTMPYVYRDRMSGNILLRSVRTNESTGPKGIRTALSKVYRMKRLSTGKPVRNLTYDRVWLSGVFYRKYEQEKLIEVPGYVPDFEYEVMLKTSERVYKNETMLNNAVKKFKKSFVKDYQKWKEAFELD